MGESVARPRLHEGRNVGGVDLHDEEDQARVVRHIHGPLLILPDDFRMLLRQMLDLQIVCLRTGRDPLNQMLNSVSDLKDVGCLLWGGDSHATDEFAKRRQRA